MHIHSAWLFSLDIPRLSGSLVIEGGERKEVRLMRKIVYLMICAVCVISFTGIALAAEMMDKDMMENSQMMMDNSKMMMDSGKMMMEKGKMMMDNKGMKKQGGMMMKRGKMMMKKGTMMTKDAEMMMKESDMMMKGGMMGKEPMMYKPMMDKKGM
ncbi:MAG TPA: hypothetical protein DEA95_06945 [Nitrospiraceae bacterium]|nr:hypothetical protein [Nitrospiraceae bacterium]